jgi:hypothetical protein
MAAESGCRRVIAGSHVQANERDVAGRPWLLAVILQLAAFSPGACQHRARSGEKARTSKRSGPPE